MLVRLEQLSARQDADQVLGMVDEDRQVRRADEELLVTVGEGEQGKLLVGGLADQAGGLGLSLGQVFLLVTVMGEL
jgi:hypothetical protein